MHIPFAKPLDYNRVVQILKSLHASLSSCTQLDTPIDNPKAHIDDGSCEDGVGPSGPMYSLTAQETVYFSQLTPNPGGARNTLVLEGLDEAHPTTITLTTLSGQVVYEQIVSAGTTTVREQIDLSELATGMYLFKEEHAGQSSVERCMKR